MVAYQSVADGRKAAAEDVAGVPLQRAQALALRCIPQLQREVVRGGAQLLTQRVPAQVGNSLHASSLKIAGHGGPELGLKGAEKPLKELGSRGFCTEQ